MMVGEAMLIQELNGLLKQQTEALSDFTFMGMTEQQAREFEYRSVKIRELQKQLGQPNVLD